MRRRLVVGGAGLAGAAGLGMWVYRAAPEFNIEGGQIKIPFSLDNRTSENVPPFLESSLPVRAIGAVVTVAIRSSFPIPPTENTSIAPSLPGFSRSPPPITIRWPVFGSR